MADPKTVHDWLGLVAVHQETAETMAQSRTAAKQARSSVGHAVECALKAYIMHKEGMNGWPEELEIHTLRALLRRSGLAVDPKDPVAPAWAVVLAWKRRQDYSTDRMSRKAARGWVEAAFGPNGVVTWIRSKLNTRI